MLAPLLFIAAALLMWGGGAKVLRPDQAARALRAVGLPGSGALVRVFGGCELGVGAAVLTWSNQAVALALAGLYVAFAAFLLLLIRRGIALSSCGCFGSVETAPSLLHLGIDLVLASAGAMAAAWPVPSLFAFARAQPMSGVPALAGMAAAVYLISIAIAFLPELFFAYGSGRRASPPVGR